MYFYGTEFIQNALRKSSRKRKEKNQKNKKKNKGKEKKRKCKGCECNFLSGAMKTCPWPRVRVKETEHSEG